jgi:hypothetical protein
VTTIETAVGAKGADPEPEGWTRALLFETSVALVTSGSITKLATTVDVRYLSLFEQLICHSKNS